VNVHRLHLGIQGIASWIVGLSTLGAGASVADGGLDGTQTVWLIRLVFGGMLLLNGYFIKQTAKKFEQQVQRNNRNTESIKTLAQIARVVITAMVSGAAGDPEVGRRKADPLLATLLREIEMIEESNLEADKHDR
jgi:uncharacterized membrane protein